MTYSALLLLALSSWASVSRAQDVCADSAGRIALADVRRLLAEAAATDSAAMALWGRRLSGPTLFADAQTRRVVANVADTEGRLAPCAGLFVGTLTPEENIANTATRWAGVDWTMVMWPLPRERYAARRLLAHELFHRVQPELGFVMRDAANPHLARRDGRIWLRLEMRALAEALIRQGAERRAALADALAFRAARNTAFPGSEEDERALELNEGVAEYTGWRLSGLPRHVLADRVAMRLEAAESGESFGRSFAYVTGPAYGVLLDERDASWQRRLRAADDLARLAARAYAITVDGRDAEQRRVRYDGAHLVAQETRRAEQIAVRSSEMKRAFVDGPVLRLALGEGMRYSFNPNQVESLEGVGTVYATSRITDEWGVLTVEAGGVLMTRDANGRITGAVVPLAGAPEPPLRGRGWRLELHDGWTAVSGAREGDLTLARRPAGR